MSPSPSGLERGAGPDAAAARPWTEAAVAGVLFALTLLVYRPVASLWWANDDTQILRAVVEYPPSRFLVQPATWQKVNPAHFTPLLPLSYGLDLALFGLRPERFYAHHLLSLAAGISALYLLLRRFRSRAIAAGACVVFLLGAPVSSMCQRLEVRHYLEGFLLAVVSALLFLQAVRSRSTARSVASAAAFLLAMLAKELYVPLLAVLLVLPAGRFRDRLVRGAPHVAALLVYLAWRTWLLGGLAPVVTARGLTPATIPASFVELVTDSGALLLGSGPTPSAVLAAALALVALAAAAAGRSRWRDLLLLAVLAGALVAPVLPVADRQANPRYLFGIWLGLVLLFAWLAELLRRVPRAGVLLALLLGSALGFVAVRQGRRLWDRELAAARRLAAEGRWLLERSEPRDVLRNPTGWDWYLAGVSWLRENVEKRGPGARRTHDDFYFCEPRPAGERVFELEPSSLRVVEVSDRVPEIRASYCGRIRWDVPLRVEVAYSLGKLSWELGPEGAGRWSILLLENYALYPLSPRGSDVVVLPGPTPFRVRHEAPDGTLTFSDPLRIVPGADEARVSWRRPGPAPVARPDG